jgi:hypothetical protein
MIEKDIATDLANAYNEGFYAGEKDMEAHYETIVLPKVRKETAREIIQLLDGHQFEDDGWTWSVSKRDLKFIAKKYGVEIEGGNEND